jgi:hypothetical protein
MIKVLYVGGNKRGIPQLSGTDIHVDYVQNGMIALSAAQTQDFDIIIIEDQLPLMSPMRFNQGTDFNRFHCASHWYHSQ